MSYTYLITHHKQSVYTLFLGEIELLGLNVVYCDMLRCSIIESLIMRKGNNV